MFSNWDLKMPDPELFKELGMEDPYWITIPFPFPSRPPSVAAIQQRWSAARIKCDKYNADPTERTYYFFSGLLEGQYWFIMQPSKPTTNSRAAALSINDIEGLFLRAFTYMDITSVYNYMIYMELIAASYNGELPG
jgi:hypothetical protein